MSHYNTIFIGKREIRYYWWGEYNTMEEAMRVYERLRVENIQLNLSYYIQKVEDSWVGGLLPSKIYVLYLNRRLKI